MTLTVRLDPTLESALERHCVNTGASKSHVVHESLAAYLMAARPSTVPIAGVDPVSPSPAFCAFADAGLVGGVALAAPDGARSADKAAVRAQVAARAQARRKPA
jgi:hypothetical protein